MDRQHDGDNLKTESGIADDYLWLQAEEQKNGMIAVLITVIAGCFGIAGIVIAIIVRLLKIGG